MKRFKKILKIFFITILFLILLGIGFTFFFGDKIEKIILTKINAKLKNELKAEIEFSLFENFPYASATLKDILILESFENSSDTLIFSAKGIIKLNILDIISEDYSIKNLAFENSVIKIKYDENGNSNFNILKDNNKGNNNFELSNLDITNSKITFLNKTEGVYIYTDIEELNCSLIKENQKIISNLKGRLSSQSLLVSNIDYINNKNVEVDSEIRINSDSVLINSKKLIIGGVEFKNLNFKYINSEYLLMTKTENENISEVILATPKKFQYLYEDHEISGRISANILIRKENEFENPYSEIDFKLTNCQYKSTSQPFELKNISADIHFDNGIERNFTSTQFHFTNFKSSKKNGDFNGDFILTNLNKYYLDADIFSSWDLKELNDFIEDSPFNNLKGTVSGNINYHGNLSFDNEMNKYFANSKHNADLKFKDVSFNYEDSKLDFKFKEMNWEINNHNIKIHKNDFKVSDSDLNFEGNIDNLILYTLEEKSKIDINGKLSSKKMFFKELFSITEINDDLEGEFTSVLPTWIDVNISIEAKQFWYDNFNASNVIGEVIYDSKNLKLSAEKIYMKTLNGNISGDINYFENRLHDLVLKSNLEINKINISEGFKSFNNFNQKFITNKNIKGTATANIYLQAMWDRNYKFYSPSLHMSSQLKIENGELIDFDPMYNLSNYVSLEELKAVKFATLENTIRIENGKIIIPGMDINSTALSVHVSGNHSFDNIMNYKIRLLLSDVLGNKVKKSIDLENIEFNNAGKTTVRLKMSGHVDNPKISLDKVKIRQDIAKEIIKEGEEVIKIIENKILNKNPKKTGDNESDKQEELDVEIEWEDQSPKR